MVCKDMMNIDINYIDGTNECRCDVSDFSITDDVMAMKYEGFTAYCNMRHVKSFEITEVTQTDNKEFDLMRDVRKGLDGQSFEYTGGLDDIQIKQVLDEYEKLAMKDERTKQ